MLQTSDAAQRLGYLKLPAGRMIRDTEVESLPPSKVLCLATGSQGEPFAAMSRIAIDDHRYVKVGAQTTRSCFPRGRFRATRRPSATS